MGSSNPCLTFLLVYSAASEQERVKRETEQQEIEKRREWVRDAIELGALPAHAAKGLAKPVPKDLE